ncbi:MAG: cytochrome c [Marinicella sp.]
MKTIKLIYLASLNFIILVVSFCLAIYALSEFQLYQVDIPPPFVYELKTDEKTINQGRHLLRTRGCFGCHGQRLEGRVKTDWDWVKQAVPPNLALYAKDHDAIIIERAIRHGIDHTERIMWTMPSYNFKHLSDDDVAAIISYLKQAPIIDNELPQPIMGLKARWQLLAGDVEHMVDWLAKVPPLKINPLDNPDLARGEYLAMTTCNECHGFDLKGYHAEVESAPDLTVMIKFYNEIDFRRLMQHGIGVGGRENLGLMSMVAKDRFAHFTEQELTDLYQYLNNLD